MHEELLEFIEDIENDIDTKAEEYIETMRGMFEATDEDILRIFDLTKKMCDVVKTKLNSNKEEA